MKLKISKRDTVIRLFIILCIFTLGFFIRLDSIYLPGIPDDEKAFYQGSDGLPYAYEFDSYYNYRLAENFLNHGYLGDTKINGREWDSHSYYPPGVPLDYPPLIVYITAFFYHFINLFATIPLLTISFWIPVFIGPISGIVAYSMVRRFTNDYGAVAAGIFIVTAPMYVIRTSIGWFDTDMFNIFFPLLVTWLFMESVHYRNNFNRGILTAFAAAFSLFLFSLAWNGWQYMLYFITIFSIFYLIWCKFKGRKVKNISYILIIFFVSSLLMVGIFSGWINVVKLFAGPFEFLKLYGSPNPWSPWPDVYPTVSELQTPSLQEIVSEIGLAFFAGILGFLWMFRILINKKLKKNLLNQMNWFFYLYLLLWALVGFFALTKGERFLMMLIPPLAISAGIFIGIAVGYLDILKDNQTFDIFRRRKNLIKIIAILILVWITVAAVLSLHQSISNLKPLANDDLWNTSEWIHNYTSQDTVIISQWSYGHLFTAIADRPVTFDGRMGYIETLPSRSYDSAYPFKEKSPGIYREYWINKAFSTSNETLSSGIFTMLASSGDLAYLTLDGYTKNTTHSVEILNNILGVDKQTANKILLNNYHLSQEQADNVLRYTHPDNPRPYVLVTTHGMLGIGADIFKFGEWDFNRMQGTDYTYSHDIISVTPETVNSSDGIIMDRRTGNLTWKGKVPYSVILITDGNIEKRYLDGNSDFVVILLLDGEESIVMDKRFEDSLFTKLIIKQSNTDIFESIYKTNNVLVWKSKI